MLKLRGYDSEAAHKQYKRVVRDLDEEGKNFSCKRCVMCRCTARRMADTAVHLVYHVLPRAP